MSDDFPGFSLLLSVPTAAAELVTLGHLTFVIVSGDVDSPSMGSKSEGRTRRQEEKEKRRDLILDAAERVIARRGLEKAHFGEIAQRSKLSRSLIYFYFPTKAELFHAVCERGLRLLEERFRRAAAKHEAGLDQVMAIGAEYHAFSRDEPLYFSLMTELQALDEEADAGLSEDEVARRHGRGCLTVVAEAIGRGLSDGSIEAKIGDPGKAAVSIWAFTHGLIQISTCKAAMLERAFGLSERAMIEHGFTLIRGALSPRGNGTLSLPPTGALNARQERRPA